MPLSTRLYIDSVLHTATNDGVSIYVVHSGDEDKGDIFIKTKHTDKTGFEIHHRSYDFLSDTYIWQTTHCPNETTADSILHQKHQQDSDCWCIDIDGSKNYFADIL